MDKVITAKELADALSVNVQTVYRWSRKNKIPFIVLPGGGYRYIKKSVMDKLGKIGGENEKK